MNSPEAVKLAEKLWAYALLHHPLEKADIIFVLGSHDTRVAEWAAELYHQGWAPLIVFSGGFAQRPTMNNWTRSEADVFAETAIKKRVPEGAILREDKAGNTGENVIFTKALLEEKNIPVKKVIAVQKPYMERRTYATIRKQWPEIALIMSTPPLIFKDYIREQFTEEHVINMTVGDFQRTKIYADRGFSIPQEFPDGVWRAYEELVKMGYDKQLVKDS